ncbi:MAG TPA: A/G-specific adenine glycosylase [Pseudobdellovibrionaceae bacterium]|nr:A/G-specific adenine glycosylase [Pseudobdellovibrionaceae bacterium]
MKKNLIQKRGQQLAIWYKENHRTLPWRKNKDPYQIWISEVMLQQTTVTAVVPYYERFLNRFPNVSALAAADEKEVLKYWSGLGYYSRARNLHKAAQILATAPFPKTYQELLKLPGFGPYTARAVSSLAFNEAVGVLDGNVIRVLSRLYALPINWWTSSGREELQKLSDELAQTTDSSIINQALMELGATICTPQVTHCHRCPWSQSCSAKAQNSMDQYPLKKPRKKIEFWLWKPLVTTQNSKVPLIKNETIPFLKGHYIFEGDAEKISVPPKKYDITHSITHHKIFVQIQKKNLKTNQKLKPQQILTSIDTISEISPSSLIQKIIATLEL